MPKRIVVVANKWFEVEPLIGALCNSAARPAGTWDERLGNWPPETVGAPPGPANPRAMVGLGDSLVEVWCIQDLMNPTVGGQYSNTGEKARVLPMLFSRDARPAHVVIAFGTAATQADQPSANGNVSVGSRVFIHNHFASNPDGSPSKWNDPANTDTTIPSSMPGEFFISAASAAVTNGVASRLLQPYGNPASALTMRVEPLGVAVSSVNVVDSSLYPITDPEALNAAKGAGADPVVSFESTHGIIRLQSSAPFFFVSGITNRVGHYGDENAAHPYTQNFVAAHNAAVALAWLLPLAARLV